MLPTVDCSSHRRFFVFAGRDKGVAGTARARDALVSLPGPLSHGRPGRASEGTPSQPSFTSVAGRIVRSRKNVKAVFFRAYGRRPQVKSELAACAPIDYTAGLGGGFFPSPQRLPRFAGGIARSRFCRREFVMPSNPPYIPPKDADLAAWLANFSSLLTASPVTYGQSSAVAVSVAAANSAYQAAYTLVTSPSTKTANTVASKNSAKVSTLAIVRPIAQQISLAAGVLTSDKIAIGVNPRTSVPTPITPPTTVPALTLRGAGPLQVIVYYRDSAASTSVKSKPYGVQFVNLYYETSATPITVPQPSANLIQLTKSPYTITFPGSAGGLQVYIWAQYVLKNGKLSSFSPVSSWTVPLAS